MTPHSKAELRAIARERRDALPRTERKACSAAFAEHFLKEVPWRNKVIAGYYPAHSELDALPLLTQLYRKGATCCLPAATSHVRILEFRRWQPDTPMITGGSFGMMEPSAEAETIKPDIVIVPLLAFDTARHRIGYGAGCYDHTLEELRHRNPKLLAIGAAFSTQRLDEIPFDDHDQPLDKIITEKGVV
ncbi:MAG: 5-formyltetrahydrofolate cyclo-ligase [Rickettsiales bacterium]